ncbi:MAG: ATP-grasp domain-containing protein [Planctomycetaceae bacterium]|nr:ATP-grasp domain-containing protein [Planctomycetaceae bacterium]
MNVLVSSAGRRGALARLIAECVARDGGSVFACDAGELSAASRLARDWARVPRCTSSEFVDAVLELCRRWDIGLIIPTIDPELPVYARHRQRFTDAGVLVSISGEQTVAIGGDKVATHEFLVQNDFPTVSQYSVDQTDDVPTLPVIIKPRFGSASHGVVRVDDAEAYRFYLRRTTEPIVQSLARGDEYTINFFVTADRRCLAAVPHRRIETRGGEVSKGVTCRVPVLVDLAEQFARMLPDPFGAMCFQAFLEPDGTPRVIELNCRFGGGYPLAHQAGADFISVLLDTAEGRAVKQKQLAWREGVTMLRWDDAVFVEPTEARP